MAPSEITDANRIFDPGGDTQESFQNHNINFASLELDLTFLHSLATNTLNLQPPDSRSKFDIATSQFLSQLDYSVLTGQDRSFDTFEYAIHVSRMERIPVTSIFQPNLEQPSEPEIIDTSDEDTVKVKNPRSTSTSKPGETGPGPPTETGEIPKDKQTPTQEPCISPLEDDIATSVEEGVNQQLEPKCIRAKHDTTDPENLRKYLAYFPLKVVKETLARTTQMARTMFSYPLVRHVKSRFPWLNRFRLNEKVSTDTMFANCQAIGGETCAQVSME